MNGHLERGFPQAPTWVTSLIPMVLNHVFEVLGSDPPK